MRLDPCAEISVVIPLYNAERFISRALTQVERQTLAPREVVVVDDGSTDSGPDRVAAFPGVQLVRQSNAGAGPARNTGVAMTTAPWVAFLDADDVWLPDHLAALLRIARDVPAAGLVSTDHLEVMDPDVPARLSRSRGGARRGHEIDYFRRAGRRIGIVWISAVAVRRAAFDDVGGFAPISLPADIEFLARIALRHPVAVSRARTALYVRNTGGLMERAAARAVPKAPEWVPLLELTPSIRATIAGRDLRRPEVSWRSIELYIDGRVTSGWRRVLLESTQHDARRRWTELHRPFHWSAWAFIIAMWTPPSVGLLAADAFRRMRSLIVRR